jgi:5-methyltetrahydrofolate--homocysteine methyltransferase
MNIREEIRKRVLLLDGAMGTEIMRLRLTEEDFRGERFADWDCQLKGLNDVLSLTRPEVITNIHQAYIDAGADIIETNSFNSNAISLREYGLTDYVDELNMTAARLARSVAGDSHFVIGTMGPTGVSLSLGQNDIDFDTMADAYRQQAAALIRGGVDAVLIETIFDTLNAKAAIAGAHRAMADLGLDIPLMLSVTLTETGHVLSGQSLEAFIVSTLHAGAMSIGLNCGFGAHELLPHIERLQQIGAAVSIHPNAGLPDESGQYTETPESFVKELSPALNASKLNIVGGCCGTTPVHISALAPVVRQAVPRAIPTKNPVFSLSGIEPLNRSGFLKVGERCNVAGSRKFLRLINENNIDEALSIAADQIGAGASVLDINMDDAMLDAATEMERFVTALSNDSRTAKVPLMIDSSDFNVIIRALKRLQGRAIVNSLSLKEGEAVFVERARQIKELGAALVVMAFDEKGQADTFERRVEICKRAYDILTREVGFDGTEIVFDPNVLAVATGIVEHNDYALSFINATRWIKENLDGALVSGGVSNLSFAFRGNDPVRRAMHAVFITRCRAVGMDMAIVNPSADIDGDHVEPSLRTAIDDVLLNRDDEATFRLVEMAETLRPVKSAAKPKTTAETATVSPSESLKDKVIRGAGENIEPLLQKSLDESGSAIQVIDNVLMAAMNRVGELFGAGEMFLPQVVRAASVMQRAVEWLSPHIEAERQNRATSGPSRRMVLATVKGDVHDIGKNIVSVVMRCSGYDIIDLGVMVPAEKIIATAKETNADFIALSGLITPSLAEMMHVASMLQSEKMTTPLFIGGATTSALHTAVKIAPLYDAPVIHTRDAASMPGIAARAFDADFISELKAEQQRLRENRQAVEILPLAKARSLGAPITESGTFKVDDGEHTYVKRVSEVSQLINRRAFLGEWKVDPSAKTDEAQRLLADMEAMLSRVADFSVTARLTVLPAHSDDNDNIIIDGRMVINTLRQQVPNPVSGRCLALSDFVKRTDDRVALFAVTVDKRFFEAESDEYTTLLKRTVANRVAEATTQWLHSHAADTGIRPAIGYPSLPDQSLIFTFDKILRYAEIGITLTENGAMSPTSSTSGIIITAPKSRYFDLGAITDEQLQDYAARRDVTAESLRPFLGAHLR